MSDAEGYPGIGRVLVIIPTYNEAENLGTLVPRVLEQGPFDVLVVDDGSPDGTDRRTRSVISRRFSASS